MDIALVLMLSGGASFFVGFWVGAMFETLATMRLYRAQVLKTKELEDALRVALAQCDETGAAIRDRLGIEDEEG